MDYDPLYGTAVTPDGCVFYADSVSAIEAALYNLENVQIKAPLIQQLVAPVVEHDQPMIREKFARLGAIADPTVAPPSSHVETASAAMQESAPANGSGRRAQYHFPRAHPRRY